jgi:hypothetical protein
MDKLGRENERKICLYRIRKKTELVKTDVLYECGPCGTVIEKPL